MSKTVRPIHYTQRPTPEPYISVNGTVPAIKDADAVIFRNAGTATIDLWLGLWTLAPGETVSFNITLDDATMNVDDIPIKFDTSTGAIQKMQIITIKSSPC